MLAHNPVADIAYLIGKQEERERAEEAAGLSRNATGDERVAALREGIRVTRGTSYYDKDSSEDEGRFWRPKLKESVRDKLMTVEPGKEARVGAGRRIAEGIETGQGIETKTARLISMGYDPITKQKLVPSACAYHEKKAKYPEKVTENDRKRAPRAGYDSTYSIDKPASALWADALTRGDHSQAKAIETALLNAVTDAEQFAYDNGLIRTRRTATDPVTGKRIEYFESVADFTSTNFLHKTNRNGDAQLHVHNLKLNACVRMDSTTGTLDTDEFYYQKPVIDAVFKASFYDRLRQIEGLEELDIVRGDKDVRIRGIGHELAQTLSSRRLEVLEELEKRGLSTADRRAAEMAAKATRNEKADLPSLSDLVGRWRETILEHTDGEGLLAKLEKREPTEDDIDTRRMRVALEAVERFGHTQTIVTERDVMTEVYRSAQGEFCLSEIPEIVHLVKSRFLIQGEYDENGRQQWGIIDLVEKERSFMSKCYDLPRMPHMASDARIESVIEKYKPDPAKKIRGLNDEQKEGIRYILSSTAAISILEGSAGAGKSFTAGRIKEVLDPAGFEVYGISPSWKATDVLREDMNLQDEMAKACAKFIADYKSGKISIGSDTIVAIDEAGMVGIDDMEYIARVVTENGGRLIMLGDTQQLSPVAAGSPMAMARKVLGSHRLNEIMRQNDPDNPERSERYREASALFVKQGRENIENALAIYRDEGRIDWKDSLEESYHAATDKFMQHYDPERPKETLIITKRNSDLHAINTEVRTSMIEKGLLGKDEIAFDSITRESKDKEVGVELRLRAGDRVIFGERLEKALTRLPIAINNSDMATIKDVRTDPESGEPSFKLVLDKAPKLEMWVTPKQLAGFREDGDKLIPKMQHAFCVTVHASQGSTVDQVIVADCHGMDYRTTYVALTRHRHDAHLIVNTSRIEDNKAAKAGIVIVDENGKMSIPDKEDGRQEVAPEDFRYTKEDYFQYIVYEASVVDDKKNFTDLDMYSGKAAMRDFLADEDWKETHLKKMADKLGDGMDIEEGRIINNKARREGKIGASLAADGTKLEPIEGTDNPYRDLKAPSVAPDIEAMTLTGGQEMDQELRERLAKRIGYGNILPPVRKVQEAPEVAAEKIELQKSRRISDAEREEFKRRDPVQFMLNNGAQLAKPWEKQNPQSVEMCDGFKGNEPYNRYTISERNGVWVWNQWNDPDMKGTLDSWMVKKGVSTSYPEAWHRLRDEFGTERLQDTKVVVKQSEKPKPTYESYRDTVASQLASTGFSGSGKAEDRLQSAIDLTREKEVEAKADKAFEPTKIERIKAATAQKMLEDIEKGEAPAANKFEQKRAENVRKLVEEGKSVHEYKFKYAMQTPWATDSYPKERGIERATIMRFEHDVKRDVVKDQQSGEWKAGLAFAHRDIHKFGTITGIESKRPVAIASNGEEMATTKFTDGEGKGLGMIGNKMRGDKGPTTIVAAESGIDALSWWQENKLPDDFKSKSDDEKLAIAKAVPDDTLMLSMAGNASSHALQGVELLAKGNPQAKWVVAPDNDFAGQGIRDNIQAAILKGNPKAEIEVQPPQNVLHKDWNDQIRDTIRKPEDLQKEADKMKLSVGAVERDVARYQAAHPDRDLSAYRGIGSKEAERSEQKQAMDVLMTGSDKDVRKYTSERRIEVLGPSRRDNAEDDRAAKAAAAKAAAERERQRREEEERRNQRASAQRM